MSWVDVRHRLAALSPCRVAILCIAVAQAVWLGTLALGGWFYGDDLTLMAQASHRGLTPSYLVEAQNDHLTPGLRLQFWALTHGLGLDYPAATVYRVALQIIATVVVGRLLMRLFGQRPTVVVLVLVYAFNALLVPSFMWLTCAVALLPAQILVVLALESHLDFLESGRFWPAVKTGLLFTAAALFWEKFATIAIVLPLITIAVRKYDRLAALGHFRKRWRGYLTEYLPLVALGIAYIAGGYGRSKHARPSAGEVARLIGDTFTHTFAPAFVGGPRHWYAVGDVYVGLGDPPPLAVWAGSALFVVLFLAGVTRSVRQAVVGWAIPFLTIGIGTAIVAFGRYDELGSAMTRVYNYAYDGVLPVVLALGLTLLPSTYDQGAQPRRLPSGLTSALTIGVVTLVVLANGIGSAVAFEQRWVLNPSRQYFATLTKQLGMLPDGAVLYDTPASLRVISFISPIRNVSHYIPLIGGHRIQYDGEADNPLIVTDTGRISAAGMVPTAQVPMHTREGGLCSDLVKGRSRHVMTLDHAARPGAWFVQIRYFQQGRAPIRITAVDRSGRVLTPTDYPRITLKQQLGTVTVLLPAGEPTHIVVASDSSATNLCLTSVVVGFPFAH